MCSYPYAPKLRYGSCFDTGLENALVNELAYQLFLSTCGYECSPDNLQAIRRHLQVGCNRRDQLLNISKHIQASLAVHQHK